MIEQKGWRCLLRGGNSRFNSYRAVGSQNRQFFGGFFGFLAHRIHVYWYILKVHFTIKIHYINAGKYSRYSSSMDDRVRPQNPPHGLPDSPESLCQHAAFSAAQKVHDISVSRARKDDKQMA